MRHVVISILIVFCCYQYVVLKPKSSNQALLVQSIITVPLVFIEGWPCSNIYCINPIVWQFLVSKYTNVYWDLVQFKIFVYLKLSILFVYWYYILNFIWILILMDYFLLDETMLVKPCLIKCANLPKNSNKLNTWMNSENQQVMSQNIVLMHFCERWEWWTRKCALKSLLVSRRFLTRIL